MHHKWLFASSPITHNLFSNVTHGHLTNILHIHSLHKYAFTKIKEIQNILNQNKYIFTYLLILILLVIKLNDSKIVYEHAMNVL